MWGTVLAVNDALQLLQTIVDRINQHAFINLWLERIRNMLLSFEAT